LCSRNDRRDIENGVFIRERFVSWGEGSLL